MRVDERIVDQLLMKMYQADYWVVASDSLSNDFPGFSPNEIEFHLLLACDQGWLALYPRTQGFRLTHTGLQKCRTLRSAPIDTIGDVGGTQHSDVAPYRS